MLELLKRILFPKVLSLTDAVEGLFGIKDSPDLPPYQQGANQTAQSSIQASLVNQYLNNINQTSPLGTRTYTQTGNAAIPTIGDMPGFNIPTFTASTTYDPAIQSAIDSLKGSVNSSVSSPMLTQGDLTSARDQVTKAMFDRGMSLLQPQFDLQNRQNENSLLAKGFSVGDEGYTKSLDQLAQRQGMQVNDLRDAALAGGTSEMQNLQNLDIQRRQEPMQELTSLINGTAPSFQPLSTSSNASAANQLGADVAQGQAELTRYGLDTQRANDIHKGIMDVWRQAAGGMGGGS